VAKKTQHSFVSNAKVSKGSKETMTEKKPNPRTSFTEEKVTPVTSLIVDDHENWNFGGKTWEVNTLQLVS
jgi:hypothetical protein